MQQLAINCLGNKHTTPYAYSLRGTSQHTWPVHDEVDSMQCSQSAECTRLSNRQGACREHPTQTNICNFGCSVLCQQDVGGLQIQVHHVVTVQKMQSLGNVQSYASAPIQAICAKNSDRTNSANFPATTCLPGTTGPAHHI